jgi:hypothetical protein
VAALGEPTATILSRLALWYERCMAAHSGKQYRALQTVTEGDVITGFIRTEGGNRSAMGCRLRPNRSRLRGACRYHVSASRCAGRRGCGGVARDGAGSREAASVAGRAAAHTTSCSPTKKARPLGGVGLHRTARALFRVPRRYPTLTVPRTLHKRRLDAPGGAGHYPSLIAGVSTFPDAHMQRIHG